MSNDDHIEEDVEGTICERCHNGYTLRPNCEPTGLCDPCAQEVAAPIWARRKITQAAAEGRVEFGGDASRDGQEPYASQVEDAVWDFLLAGTNHKRGWFSWDRSTVRSVGSRSLDVSAELAAHLTELFGVPVERDTPIARVAQMVRDKGRA